MPLLSQNQCKFIRSLQLQKNRDQENLFFVEGMRLCEELVRSAFAVQYFIINRDMEQTERIDRILADVHARNIPVYEADDKQLQSIADTRQPQGIAAVACKNTARPDFGNSRILLGLDSIRDPGNLGTIIRTAEWFGIDGVITGQETVEIYNPKTVRSTMGALFHIPILENVALEKELTLLKEQQFTIAGAVSETGVPLAQYTRPGKIVLLIGNEAQGLRPELESILDVKVNIPGKGKSESLNAAIAAGILLYHLTQND